MGNGHLWKRLTVSEAAEVLQISKDAVRKRMQRGTLRHDKTLDGRVYVYLDDEEGVDGIQGESRGRLLQLADAASLVAVISLGTYLVGLFVFWYPISITYTGDFATAWYATSLVPRNVVVGHGVQQLLLPYLAIVLLVVALYLLPYYIGTRPRLRDKPALVKYAFALALAAPPVAAAVTFLIWNYSRVFSLPLMAIAAAIGEIFALCYFLWYRLGLRDKPKRVKRAVALAFILFTSSLSAASAYYLGAAGMDLGGLKVSWVTLAIGAPFWVLAGALMAAATKVQHSILEPEGKALEASSFGESLQRLHHGWRTYPRHFIGFVGLGFAAYFALVLAISIYDTKPPLSRVEISGQRPVQGQLLTHADGFWYVFEHQEDKQGDKQQEDKREVKLVAIPDAKVEDVEVSE